MKKVLLWFGFAFVAYTVVAAPTTAAQAVKQSVASISSAGQSLGDFFNALIS